METFAPAKLNLALDVLGKRPDGYHDLRMVMQSVSLTDTLTVERCGGSAVQVTSSLHFLPQGERNLAGKAVLRFYEALGGGVKGTGITIRKRIPVCAGMGGGSSDAAAVLRTLNQMEGSPFSREELCRIGGKVGSDVPYCVLGGTALAEGRGERLTVLPPLPPCWAVVCKPDFPVSTPELFARIDGCRLRRRPDTAGVLAALQGGDLAGVARRMYNVFEDVLPPRQLVRVQEIRKELIGAGALGACMTGTGPSVFGLFENEEDARAAAEALGEDRRETFLVHTL